MKYIFAVAFLSLLSIISVAQDGYIILYPQDNGFENIVGTTQTLASNPMAYNNGRKDFMQIKTNLDFFAQENKDRKLPPEGVKGEALNFVSVIVSDTAKVQMVKSKLPNTPILVLKPIAVVDVSKIHIYDNITKTLTAALGNDFIDSLAYSMQTKTHQHSSAFYYDDGMIAYSYKNKHCMLLWDAIGKRYWSQYEVGNTGSPQTKNAYAFDYSLKDAKQIALCKYSDECYVLLLLTTPIVSLNEEYLQ